MMLSQTSGEDEKDISVNFMKASLSNTSWTIQGLNLFINDSNLASVQFFIRHKVICVILGKQCLHVLSKGTALHKAVGC